MIYQITDSGVRSARTLREFNNRYHELLEESEMVPLGPDMVVYTTQRDIDFLMDKAKVSNIMFSQFFRKDNSVKIFAIINIILTVLVLFVR